MSAFKKLKLPRPITGDLINDADLIWRVTEVRLKSGQEQVGIQMEPASEDSKRTVEDVSGESLRRAGWEVFHPRAHGN